MMYFGGLVRVVQKKIFINCVSELNLSTIV